MLAGSGDAGKARCPDGFANFLDALQFCTGFWAGRPRNPTKNNAKKKLEKYCWKWSQARKRSNNVHEYC